MTQPLLYIIVLNNNRRDDTLACLASLYCGDYQNFRVILLDYDSTDGSIDAVRAKYAEVETVTLDSNLGYAGNNNVGIKIALDRGADWVFILNNDTILDPSCLSRMVDAGDADAQVGMVGPMVYHFDEPEVIQSAGGKLEKYWRPIHLGMNELDQGQFKSVRQVDWLSGCAILVRRDLVEQAGALDPDYFLYWEETEWCIRAGQAGWKIVHVPNAKLWHKGVKRNYEPRPYITYYMTRNYLFTLAKHKAPLFVRMFAFSNILRTLLSWSVKPRWSSKRDHRNAMWRGLLDFLNHRVGPMPL
jgi:GT2 family glycosyltransferase